MSAATPPRYPPLPDRFEPALERLGGDRSLLRDMAEIFVEDLPPVMLELDGLWAKPESSPQLARTAHKLKGMVVTFDDEQVGPLVQQLVIAARDGDRASVDELRPQVQDEVNKLYRHVMRLTKD